LVPMIHGDVVFDEVLGGTILSTEELFLHLGKEMKPERILLTGREEGVWQDFPNKEILIKELTPELYLEHRASLREGLGVDITGGMQTKVATMVSLVEIIPGLEVFIFSGEISGNVHRALCGDTLGTKIYK
jgi:isopentenyl phosphate kinase